MNVRPLISALLLCIFLAACGNDLRDDAVTRLERALIEACPISDPSDVTARDMCGEALINSQILDDLTPDVLLWGGQPDGFTAEDLLTQASLTALDQRVWRRMYLSAFMFADAPATVDQSGDYRLLRVPVQFRFDLPAGDYPYPFWHSQAKWTSYQTATEVVFVIDNNDRILAGARSATKDASRPQRERTWDGIWTWDEGREPRVSLYAYLFSPNNPYVSRLETAYRSLEEGLREHDCTRCHDPSNAAGTKRLEILSYPNQALTARRIAAGQVERALMPPGPPSGIEDLEMRAELVRRATEFADAGDAALAFESQGQ